MQTTTSPYESTTQPAHRSGQRSMTAPSTGKPDRVVRWLAFLTFVQSLFGLAVTLFLFTMGPEGMFVAAMVGLPSLLSLVAAVGLVKMKRWARNFIVFIEMVSLARAIIPSTDAAGAGKSPFGMVFSFVIIAWMVYRWDRFQN